ncbi:hypothetical protein F4820DRAFT_101196 [Hypoxylon rubiginosum]|uniref:Uncharacterized protein n=1 Tax=Hypoxylon rubiginosum TaxID=110542 RepID=A0ACB9ZBB0_9PEZI|nr:hypothetical protein F4820DRAFT_101196 [Hypoxylon rubiginosum]
MDQHQNVDVEEGHGSYGRIDQLQQAPALIRHIRNSLLHRRRPQPYSHSPVSSIPRTSPERLALASPDKPDDASAASTILYLAYGSNLSSETFLRARGTKPVSQVNVSAPAFDLAFDLPGLPYWEPCFSNVTPRKIPIPPIPGDPPKNPFPPPPSAGFDVEKDVVLSREGLPTTLLPSFPPDVPTWSKGLYGVVYEVTQKDYRKIIRTEANAYHDILAPCLALPPPLHVPEKPPIPDLPRPFMAHTLYAPRVPDFPGDGDNSSSYNGGDDDDDDDGGDKAKKWWQKLLLPVRRPNQSYAQPSARYLGLIRAGAYEHYLPDDYQAYLARIEHYSITTWRQEVGRWLLLLMVLPFFGLIQVLSSIFAKEDGSVPTWLGAASTVFVNLVWIAYDSVFKPVFGDGERTIEDDDDSNLRRRENTGNIYRHARGSERNTLLADW